MKLASRVQDIPFVRESIVTVGTFDGIHLGHQYLVKRLVTQARSNGWRSVVITFDPHPQSVVNPERAEKISILTTKEEKIALLASLEIDSVLVLQFDSALARRTADEFVDDVVCSQVGVSKFLIGHDHAFGSGRQGDVNTLHRLGRDRGFVVEKVEAFLVNGHPIKSTLIRSLLRAGNVTSAAGLLGRPYSISGIVRSGDGRGKMLGFPTANLHVGDPMKTKPSNGVYSTKVQLGDMSYRSVTNIGHRPTFGDRPDITIETHLLSFDDELRGKPITLEFLGRIRDEMKFDSEAALARQIRKDISEAQSMR